MYIISLILLFVSSVAAKSCSSLPDSCAILPATASSSCSSVFSAAGITPTSCSVESTISPSTSISTKTVLSTTTITPSTVIETRTILATNHRSTSTASETVASTVISTIQVTSTVTLTFSTTSSTTTTTFTSQTDTSTESDTDTSVTYTTDLATLTTVDATVTNTDTTTIATTIFQRKLLRFARAASTPADCSCFLAVTSTKIITGPTPKSTTTSVSLVTQTATSTIRTTITLSFVQATLTNTITVPTTIPTTQSTSTLTSLTNSFAGTETTVSTLLFSTTITEYYSTTITSIVSQTSTQHSTATTKETATQVSTSVSAATTTVGIFTSGAVDDASYIVTIPFAITLYGQVTSTITVNSNGWFSASRSALPGYNYHNLPASQYDAGTPAVFAFWYDLFINSNAGDKIFYTVAGPIGARILAIEWKSTRLGYISYKDNFRVVANEATPGIFYLEYPSIANNGKGVNSNDYPILGGQGSATQYVQYPGGTTITNGMRLKLDSNANTLTLA